MNVGTRRLVPQISLPSGYLPALEGLRGLAIVGVLLFHTGHLDGGFLGVDLFFALSGYLITGLLLREANATGTLSLVRFWGRRLRRLLPALAVVLVVVTLVVWTTSSDDLVRTTLADGPWVQANLYNWHLLAESASYWDGFGAQRVFDHLWSIAVEEQFYVVWPVLVLCLCRLGGRVERRVAVVALALSGASLVAMIALYDAADPTRAYIGTDTRAFSLLLGAAAATAPVKLALDRVVGERVGVVGVVLAVGIAASWLLVNGTETPGLFMGGLFVHSAASAAVIALCAAAPHTYLSRALAMRPLRWLGQISYSLYLWHWPVIVLLTPAFTGLDGWALTFLVWGVSITAAAVSKKLIEDPVRYRATWVTGRTGFAVLLVVTACVAAMWFLLPGPAPTTIDISNLE